MLSCGLLAAAYTVLNDVPSLFLVRCIVAIRAALLVYVTYDMILVKVCVWACRVELT